MHFAVLLIVIAVQQAEDSCNVVISKQKFVLYCSLMLILIALQQSVDSCNVLNFIH